LGHAVCVVVGFVLLHTLLAACLRARGQLLLESGDSAVDPYPGLYGPWSLWEPKHMAGYARPANPRLMTRSPPADTVASVQLW